LRILALIENTTKKKELLCEHGLSLYLETEKRKVIFDTGASPAFAKNAKALGVDLSAVDLAVLSHGHYDHGGGLATFLELNSRAKIYLDQKAFGEYYANAPDGTKRYIGLDPALAEEPRFVFLRKDTILEEGMELFSEVTGDLFCASGNAQLLAQKEGCFFCDPFEHEQNLAIMEKGKRILIAGCAHRGIANILTHYQRKYNSWPDHVVGGFHLSGRSAACCEPPEFVVSLGNWLLKTGAMFHTCHCTGLEAYRSLKEVMGEKIEYLSTGSEIIIE